MPTTTRRTRSTAKSAPKPAAKRAATATVKSKSKSVLLDWKASKVSKEQFGGKDIITGLYVSKDAVDELNQGKTFTRSFKPFAGDQPKNSIRFTESGKADDHVIGSLYLMRPQSAKLGITEKSTVTVKLAEANGQLKVTITVA